MELLFGSGILVVAAAALLYLGRKDNQLDSYGPRIEKLEKAAQDIKDSQQKIGSDVEHVSNLVETMQLQFNSVFGLTIKEKEKHG